MTTPPCQEGVLWLVMKEPIQASPAQMALFSRLYPLNSRPIQPSSGRIIKESN
jgi:carbonic anhydrase